MLTDGVVQQSHLAEAYLARTHLFLPLRLASYSARSAACTSARPSALVPRAAATPQLAVTLSAPPPSRRGMRSCRDLLADALGAVERALEIGPGQDGGELLAAVAGGVVDLARALAQHARDLAQDDVALRVAVGVVDELEVVEVDQHEPEVGAEALGALDLGRRARRRRRAGWRGRSARR